jgi:hypothetical protein
VIIEISGKCKNCGSDYKILVDHGKSKDPCQYCGEQPFDCKIIEGIIYTAHKTTGLAPWM